MVLRTPVFAKWLVESNEMPYCVHAQSKISESQYDRLLTLFVAGVTGKAPGGSKMNIKFPKRKRRHSHYFILGFL